eukprot:14133682-Alexandrium_andersonii.AAC.1
MKRMRLQHCSAKRTALPFFTGHVTHVAQKRDPMVPASQRSFRSIFGRKRRKCGLSPQCALTLGTR